MKQKHNMKPMAKSHHSVTSKILLVILALFTFIGGMKAQAVTGVITLQLIDEYGDGWSGSAIQVVDLCTDAVLGTFYNTEAAGKNEAQTYTLSVLRGSVIQFQWISGEKYVNECSYVVKGVNDEEIFSGSGAMDAPVTYTVSGQPVMPLHIKATNIGRTTATLKWEGNADSYVLLYRRWHQVGNDATATNELTEYTFDLHGYSGTGSIAIRHYNVSDMFRLAVDDIGVKDALGNNLFSEGFESGVIPSNMKNIDLDGDGYIWNIGHFGNSIENGNYCVYSESYINPDDDNSNAFSGALTPDNWLIIPNVELGGTLTFSARGVADSYPAEKFGVFVVTNGEWVEKSITNTSYQLTGLEANTLYEWQVKSVYGNESSNWSSFSFSTTNLIDVVLNDNASNSSAIEGCHSQSVNAILQGRTLWKDGDWNTLCLPFNMTAQQIADSPLADATVMEFAGSTSAFDETSGELTLNFVKASTIDAGKPYIVKWDATTPNYMENPVFAGVTINSANIATVNSSDDKVSFTGTYGPLTYDTEDKSVLFLGSGSTLYYPEAGASINAFRAFFQLNGLTAGEPKDSSTPVKSFVLNFGEDTETGIFDVRSKMEDGRGDGVIYNIAGQRLNKPQRGINIVNGRKIVIK